MTTRQKSDDRVVPDGTRKDAGSPAPSGLGGGKAVAVNQQVGQLQLPFATADVPPALAGGPVSSAGGGRPPPVLAAEPKAKVKEEGARPATMEGVVAGLDAAFE